MCVYLIMNAQRFDTPFNWSPIGRNWKTKLWKLKTEHVTNSKWEFIYFLLRTTTAFTDYKSNAASGRLKINSKRFPIFPLWCRTAKTFSTLIQSDRIGTHTLTDERLTNEYTQQLVDEALFYFIYFFFSRVVRQPITHQNLLRREIVLRAHIILGCFEFTKMVIFQLIWTNQTKYKIVKKQRVYVDWIMWLRLR